MNQSFLILFVSVLLVCVFTLPTQDIETKRTLNVNVGDAVYGGRIFLSTSVLSISSGGGVSLADSLCQKEGKALDPTSDNWAAIITDEGIGSGSPDRRASILSNKGDGQINWVFQPNATYYLIDNTTIIGVTDDTALLKFPLTNAITPHCANQASGMEDDWTTTVGASCQDWQVASSDPQQVGWSCATTANLLNGGDLNCDVSTQFLCVSPFAKRNTPPLCANGGVCVHEKCADPADSELSCECRCGCIWANTASTSRQRTTQGAAILKKSIKSQELTELGSLVNPEVVLASRVPIEAPQANGTCSCKDRGGIPACQDQYPAPDNSSLVQFASGSFVNSSDRIVLFGDSITWLGGYMSVMQTALAASKVTPTFINRGVNGGKILDIRDGCGSCGYPGFDAALLQDKPTLINIMIGINDVWFQGLNGTSNATQFASILTDLIQRAKKAGIKVAISTVSVIGEKTDGTNGHDQLLNDFAAAARYVATSTGTALSDVHADYLLYEQLYNDTPPGRGLFNGILTVDGVHPCEGSFDSCPDNTHGNYLLANAISRGFIVALSN